MNIYFVEGLSSDKAADLLMSCIGNINTANLVRGRIKFIIEEDELPKLKELCARVGAVPTFSRTIQNT